jgi:hypothetical protein
LLLRLHADPSCCGAARRALGEVLDYLLHLTPRDELRAARGRAGGGPSSARDRGTHPQRGSATGTTTTTAGVGATAAAAAAAAACSPCGARDDLTSERLRRAAEGDAADVDESLEPLCADGVGLAAHADVICMLHRAAGLTARVGPIPALSAAHSALAAAVSGRAERLGRAKGEAPTSRHSLDETLPGSGVGAYEYVCNMDVLCLMLQTGYVRRRVGSAASYARLLLAMLQGHADGAAAAGASADPPGAIASEPPFMLRVLADAAWRCVRTAKVRAGARDGSDSWLAEAEAQMGLLGPSTIRDLLAELTKLCSVTV